MTMRISTRPLAVLLGTAALQHQSILKGSSSRLGIQSAIAFTTLVPSLSKRGRPTSSDFKKKSNCGVATNTNKNAAFHHKVFGKMLSSSASGLNEAVAVEPMEVFGRDYKAPNYMIDTVAMDFDIHVGETIVSSTFSMKRREGVSSGTELELDGESSAVELLSLEMNGVALKEEDYTIHANKVVIAAVPSGEEGRFELKTKVRIHPEENTQLSGLYQSSGMYCTQCEAMGFRRITYYVDRPDNMAVFESVRIEADKATCPVLLSNGNEVEAGDVAGSNARHYAIWKDPFPKPSYLFAVVAGDLSSISDTFTTMSGRHVKLEIFSEEENVNKLGHAMASLKKSMKWDEEKFGLEYDLDVFNVVAVNDFNMGAMENKGLNVFNTAYVLASPSTATDTDYEMVEGVIAHEYFHNWTGNRVTCRDWFQLTLKEGLTVYRDQQFSADMMDSRAVKRIEDVRSLRARQFAEDAGPMKHPIRPESYISMDNFYTATVYSKGAEVVRMYATILSEEGFRKGMDLYFERHDGSAVTCDDFRQAMEDANDIDFTVFDRWYSTPGTPTVSYSANYEHNSLRLTFKQSSLSKEGLPLHIPIKLGLIDGLTGEEVLPTTVLQLVQNEQTFTFSDLKPSHIVPSILRDFSAPVKLVPQNTNDPSALLKEYAFLAAYDTDDFNKWEAGQKLYTAAIFNCMQNEEQPDEALLTLLADTFTRILKEQHSSNFSITAYALSLPSESALMEELTPPIDPIALHRARTYVRSFLANKTHDLLHKLYQSLTDEMNSTNDGTYSIESIDIGRRRLRNLLLSYLCADTSNDLEKQQKAASIAYDHYTNALGMTDKLSALSFLVSFDDSIPHKQKALSSFYEEANSDPLVINKWFMAQASADTPTILEKVKELTKHPDFTLKNPNRCRSLISVYAANLHHFHAESGEGYAFLTDIIKQVDALNPQLSSGIARSFMQWRRFDEKRSLLMKDQLVELKGLDGISDDLFEVVTRGLL